MNNTYENPSEKQEITFVRTVKGHYANGDVTMLESIQFACDTLGVEYSDVTPFITEKMMDTLTTECRNKNVIKRAQGFNISEVF